MEILLYRFWKFPIFISVIVLRRDIPAAHFVSNSGAQGIAAAQKSFGAWLALARGAKWRQPADITVAHPKASILRSGRVVFNIKGNDYRLVCQVNYAAGTVEIRFFDTHAVYDTINAGTI
jgi:mRNA interferase HigB